MYNMTGDVYAPNASYPVLTDCTFTHNTATQGGGFYNQSGNPELNTCTFTANSAAEGGGMYEYTGSSVVMYSRFRGNRADVGGGMASGLSSPITESRPLLRSCVFVANVANDGGGGISINENGYPTLVNCMFTGKNLDFKMLCQEEPSFYYVVYLRDIHLVFFPAPPHNNSKLIRRSNRTAVGLG